MSNRICVNLLHPNEEQIKIIQFPDGQQNVEISESVLSNADTVDVLTRLSSWKDVELLMCIEEILHHKGIEVGVANVTYLMGARSDRRFSDNSANYLQSFVDLLTNATCWAFNILDVHNKHALPFVLCADDLIKFQSPTRFIEAAIRQFEPDFLIFPDKGAASRYKDLKLPVVCADKVRTDGNVTSVVLKDPIPITERKRGLVIDDLCDGGGTFLELAKQIPGVNLGLYVTHGIFSKGLGTLCQHYERIFCTDSYRDYSYYKFLTEYYVSVSMAPALRHHDLTVFQIHPDDFVVC